MHRDLKAENLLLDNNMNIKIAGNWDTAVSSMIGCAIALGVCRNRPVSGGSGACLPMTSSFHQKKKRKRKKGYILFISLDLYVMKSKRNQFIINVHSGRVQLGSDLCPGPFVGSARGGTFV